MPTMFANETLQAALWIANTCPVPPDIPGAVISLDGAFVLGLLSGILACFVLSLINRAATSTETLKSSESMCVSVTFDGPGSYRRAREFLEKYPEFRPLEL